MFGLFDWFKGILIDGIIANFTGLFTEVNQKVGEIGVEVGKTPQGWNPGIFSMIRNLSETVVLPIAGMILTFVLVYELIHMIMEKNNMHDFDTSNIFKWIFKSFIAIYIMTNTFNIVNAVFGVSQHVVNQSAGIISGSTAIDISSVTATMRVQLEAMGTGELLGLYFESMFVGLTIWALSLCIFIIVFGRMIEIYLVTSVAPIPFATMVNREWGQIGNNYLKSLFALAFQGFLIMVCVGIYAVLIQTISFGGSIHSAIWSCLGYTVLLCFTLFKTGSLSKSIFSAH